MLREILGAIDFQNTPDSTRLMKQFFEVQYEWVSSLLQQKFQTGFVHSSVEQIESRVKATYQSYGRIIDTPFQLYGITLSLAIEGGENEKALQILAELHESSIPQIRASADLSLLLRRENIPLDVDAVVTAINVGMIFQYPFNWYPILLEHLIPYNQQYPEIAEAVYKHFEKESLEFTALSPYKLFRFLETAIYLTKTDHITKSTLDYLYFPAENWSRNNIEELYVKRFRPMVIDLLERNTGILSSTIELLDRTPRERWHTLSGLWDALPQLDPACSQMEVLDFLIVLIDRFNLNEEYVWNALNHYYKDEKFRPLIFQWVFNTLEEAITKGIRKKKERIQYMFYYLDESLLRDEKVQQELMRGAKEGKAIQIRQICIGILLRINPEAEELYDMIRVLEKRFVKFALAHPEEMVNKHGQISLYVSEEQLISNYDKDSALRDFYKGFHVGDELKQKLLQKMKVYQKLKNKQDFLYF